MSEIEKNISEITKHTILMDFLGAENVEDLKKRIVDVLVNEVESSYDYILNLDAIVEEIIDEVQEELKPIIKEKILAKAMKELGLE